MRLPNYEILDNEPDHILLQDLGPWDRYPTITNAAEEVVIQIAPQLRGRKLFYIDSEGERTELLVNNRRFAGFAFPGH